MKGCATRKAVTFYLRMFTGIAKGLGTVASREEKPGLVSFEITLPKGQETGLEVGASVSIAGVCLTAARVEKDRVHFDVMEETLRKTNLKDLKEGDQMNVERSYRMGEEVGGHEMSGHITGTAEIIAIETPENNRVLTFHVPHSLMKYLLPKGFVGLDGCSLTIVDVDTQKDTFTIWLIPETLRITTFAQKKVGDHVNLELDAKTQAIVDTVESYLSEYPSAHL